MGRHEKLIPIFGLLLLNHFARGFSCWVDCGRQVLRVFGGSCSAGDLVEIVYTPAEGSYSIPPADLGSAAGGVLCSQGARKPVPWARVRLCFTAHKEQMHMRGGRPVGTDENITHDAYPISFGVFCKM